jgi:DNA primase small subunit
MTPAQYFHDVFPCDRVGRMLSLHSPLDCCEVALRGETWFSRHNAVGDAAGMRRAVTRPGVKEIHLGASWPEPMNKQTVASGPAVGKALVFDLDLQDQPCAAFFGVPKEDQEGNDALLDCVLLGARVLEEALRKAYGFEQFATFYSGRRGVHLWVLDARAFGLSSAARACVVASLRSNKQIAQSASFASAVDMLVEGFSKTECFKQERYRRHFGDLLGVRAVCNQSWVAAEDPWGALLGRLGKQWCLEKLRSTIVKEAWPRIDEGACALEHLVKAPFSPHSATGRISVPIYPSFDPRECPNLSDRQSLCRVLVGCPSFSVAKARS